MLTSSGAHIYLAPKASEEDRSDPGAYVNLRSSVIAKHWIMSNQ